MPVCSNPSCNKSTIDGRYDRLSGAYLCDSCFFEEWERDFEARKLRRSEE